MVQYFLNAFRSTRNSDLKSYFKSEYGNDWKYAYSQYLHTKQLHPQDEKVRW
jgi:hypothetical protein